METEEKTDRDRQMERWRQTGGKIETDRVQGFKVLLSFWPLEARK